MIHLALEQLSVTSLVFANDQSRLYRGVAQDGQKPVMLKTSAGNEPDARGRERLVREHELLADLACPGTPQPYGLVERDRSLVLVHEDIGGELLEAQIGGQPYPLDAFFPIALSLVATLECLHRHQVVHRNIQPTSIISNPGTGQVQLIDFALASRLDREQVQALSPDKLEGSLAYLAPEQTGRMNRSVDYRADFYALGVTLYELLTGRKPFVASDALELVHCHLARPPRAPRSLVPAVPEPLSDIVLKLLA